MKSDNKKTVQYRIDNTIKEQFEGACKIKGLTYVEGILLAMQDFTKKHVKEVDKK